MIMISSTELRNNMEKYFELAKLEKVVIQRENAEIFVLSEEKFLKPDKDLARAVTVDELLIGVKQDIREIYKVGK